MLSKKDHMNYIFCIPNSFMIYNLKKLNYFSYLTSLGWISGVPVSHICTIIKVMLLCWVLSFFFFFLFTFRYWKNEWLPVFVWINHSCFNHTGLETNHQPPGNHWLLGENNIFLSWLVGGCWRFLAVSCLAFLLQPGTAFCLRANSLVSFTLSRLPIPLCYQFHLETATNLQKHFPTSQTHQEYIFFPSEWWFSRFKTWMTGVLTDAPFPQQSLLTIYNCSH